MSDEPEKAYRIELEAGDYGFSFVSYGPDPEGPDGEFFCEVVLDRNDANTLYNTLGTMLSRQGISPGVTP